LRPLPIPILIGQFLNTDVFFDQGVRIEGLQNTIETSAGFHTPLWFRPIEMDNALLLPPALDDGISQPAEQLCRINGGPNLDIDPSL
jgi:hypothetical protein